VTEHTPTPWELEAGKFGTTSICAGKHIIAQTYRCGEDTTLPGGTNAAFIVKACNAHEALVKALEQIVAAGSRSELVRIGDAYAENGYQEHPVISQEAEIARAALDAATPAQSSKGE
jgi:hypothetical protein